MRSRTKASGTSRIRLARATCSVAGLWKTRTASSGTTASPTGRRRTRAKTPRPSTSAAATPARERGGTRATHPRQSAGSGAGARSEFSPPPAAPWLGAGALPEPFCLVVSLVNPHDVLGYPASYLRGGYAADEFRGLGVELPPTVDEELGTKPAVHSLARMGMNAYLGPLRNRRAQLDYVNFYAHLHRVVDRKIGRLLAALGSADDPESLRARTVIARCSDHGEMGLAHGGLRQKMFNAYEETINVPIVLSNPALFGRPAETDALASLVDLAPTLLTLGGRDVPD